MDTPPSPSSKKFEELLLFISVECFFERQIAKQAIDMPSGGWRGLVCGLPGDWERMMDARGEARLPEPARWRESLIFKMAQEPSVYAGVNPTTPIFVAAQELGVMYWPWEISVPVAAGASDEAMGRAMEAIEKRMALIAGAVAVAGGCESPMELGRFEGSAARGWAEACPGAVSLWAGMKEARSIDGEIRASKASAGRPGL